MEYYLALSEYLTFADGEEMDALEKRMCLDEINRYLCGAQAEEDRNVYIDTIGEYYKTLKGA